MGLGRRPVELVAGPFCAVDATRSQHFVPGLVLPARQHEQVFGQSFDIAQQLRVDRLCRRMGADLPPENWTGGSGEIPGSALKRSRRRRAMKRSQFTDQQIAFIPLPSGGGDSAGGCLP